LSARWDAADQSLAYAALHGPHEEKPTVDALRSEALAQLGQQAEALALAQAAAETSNQLLPRHMLARRLKEAGRIAEARFEYSTLVRQIPPNYLYAGALREEYAELQGSTP
jgi:hypothetical protein